MISVSELGHLSWKLKDPASQSLSICAVHELRNSRALIGQYQWRDPRRWSARRWIFIAIITIEAKCERARLTHLRQLRQTAAASSAITRYVVNVPPLATLSVGPLPRGLLA